MLRLNPVRIESVADAFRELSLDSILVIEERMDPQYTAMQRIARRHGRGVAAVFGLLTGLVSYRLAMTGEEWWACLADYLEKMNVPKSVDEIIHLLMGFIDSCRGSVIARDAKKRRISRTASNARHVLEAILEEPRIVVERPSWIINDIARVLGVEPWRKTIVFSLKIAYYAVREPGSLEPLEAMIPLPIDLRVSCLTYTSGIVDARSYREIQAKQKPAQDAWSMVSRTSGIPPMHVDTILWLSGRYVREHERNKARRMITEMLSSVVERRTAFRVASELTWRECI